MGNRLQQHTARFSIKYVGVARSNSSFFFFFFFFFHGLLIYIYITMLYLWISFHDCLDLVCIVSLKKKGPNSLTSQTHPTVSEGKGLGNACIEFVSRCRKLCMPIRSLSFDYAWWRLTREGKMLNNKIE